MADPTLLRSVENGTLVLDPDFWEMILRAEFPVYMATLTILKDESVVFIGIVLAFKCKRHFFLRACGKQKGRRQQNAL